MPSIRISKFAGLTPALSNRLLDRTNAEIAHNCLLWDGTLRPFPDWVLTGIEQYNNEDGWYSGLIENPRNGKYITNEIYKELVQIDGAPFASLRTLGIESGGVLPPGSGGIYEVSNSRPVGIPKPNVFNCTITYSAQNLSQKPVNRMLGITAVRLEGNMVQESSLTVLPNQAPFGTMFEGDIVGIQANVGAVEGVNFINIYRTISGLDSGEQAANVFDTDWHLVARVPYGAGGEITYFDGGSATTDPLDLLLTKNFYPPGENYNYLGMLDSGWIWAGNSDGRIDFSERYLYHAWPTENRLDLQVDVVQMKSSGDNIYVGTVNKPFVVSVSPGEGEQGARAAAVAFPERLPCRPRTMSPMPGGVVYASPQGIVALTKSGAKVISAGVVNPGDVLYRQAYYNVNRGEVGYTEGTINKTIFGINWNGQYYGFINSDFTYSSGSA